MNDDTLKLFLSGEVRVVFRKKTNNLIRSLLGTLNKDDIPPEHYSTLPKAIDVFMSDKAVIWDMEYNDWRSFYWSTVIDILQTEQKKEIQ
mgnify:CR=1 FL=1